MHAAETAEQWPAYRRSPDIKRFGNALFRRPRSNVHLTTRGSNECARLNPAAMLPAPPEDLPTQRQTDAANQVIYPPRRPLLSYYTTQRNRETNKQLTSYPFTKTFLHNAHDA